MLSASASGRLKLGRVGQRLTNEEILKFQKRARYVAAKRGYPELADDFAQEVFIAFARGWHSTVEQLFSSYLRGEHGDTRTQCGLERRRAKARTVSLDQPIDEEEGGTNYHDLIGDPNQHTGDIESNWGATHLLTTRQATLYQLFYIEGYKQVEMASLLGIHPAYICHLMKPLKREVENMKVMSEVWERYMSEPGYSKLAIDWIRL